MTELMSELFATKALEMAAPDHPFWYTSGTFGPFYINTHYLYGSKEEASNLLLSIENELKEMPSFYKRIESQIKYQLSNNDIYGKTIDLAAAKITDSFDLDEIDFISGGERRDFFFSLPLAERFSKAHLTLRKDGSAYLYSGESDNISCIAEPDLSGKVILHVADIITLASSWLDKWLPAVKKHGSVISYGFAILDRCQGGLDRLKDAGIKATVLQRTDKDFFMSAVAAGMLTEKQSEQALIFLKDPLAYEQNFLRTHPGFIENEITRGGKTATRARLYQEQQSQSYQEK